MIPILFILGIAVGAFGGILMKIGATQIGRPNISNFPEVLHYLVTLFSNLPSLAGVCLYFFSAVIWAFLLTRLDISFVQPILALTYVVTPLLAIFMLGEHVYPIRWVGIAIIILGVFIVTRSAANI